MLSFRRVASSLAILTMCWSAGASAQTVATEGDHFTYDRLPRFLVFVSYFDGLRASDATLDNDFAFLRSMGIDGVRVMANWWVRGEFRNFGTDTLVDGGGRVNTTTYSRLRVLLNKAAQHHLAVDLTFTFDTVFGGSRDSEVLGIQTVNSRLANDGFANAIVDVQNEWPRWFTSTQVVPLRNAVSGRAATASTSGGYDLTATINAASEQGLDTIAYHETRSYGWWNQTSGVVQYLHGSGRPVYLQEPAKYTDTPGITADNFITAVTNAKAAGAAGWTFHTLAARDLNGRSMTDSLAPIERDVLNRFRAAVDGTQWGAGVTTFRSVHLQSWNGAYMVAENGGGTVVNADRPVAGPWETFTMHDLDGGELRDGDIVTFRTINGDTLLQAEQGGFPAARLLAIGGAEGPWEMFTIFNLDRPGRVIGSGDRIALRSVNGYYVVAEGGGGSGSVVNANRSAIGPWETWTLVVSSSGIDATALRSVNLQSWNGPYMVAENGGGTVVHADRPVAGPWETFTMHDLDGGALQDGDTVTFLTINGNTYLQAEQGGSPRARMLAIGGAEGAWETFTIVNLDRPGGAIVSGDRIALRSVNGYYVVAEGAGGSGSVVNANRSAIGPWETWTLVFR